MALLVLNDTDKTQKFNLVQNGHCAALELEAGALATSTELPKLPRD